MPVVEVIRSKSPRVIENGDLIIIDDDPYMAVSVEFNKMKLISLVDGNRWSDLIVSPGLDLDDLSQFIYGEDDEVKSIEIIKENDYKIKINIK